MVRGVPGGDVVDDPIPAFHAEIDVEVRQRHPFGVEKAFEQQVVPERIEIGDPERVGDERSGAGAAARADRNVMLSRPPDEIGHDEEIARVPHAGDDSELLVEALPIGVRVAAGVVRPGSFERCSEPPAQPGARPFGEPLVEVVTLRNGEFGEVTAAECDLRTASARDLDGVLQCLGEIFEQRGHLAGRLEVLLLAVDPRAPRIGQYPTFLDAHPRLMRLEVVAFEKSDVVARDQRKLHRKRQIDRRLQARCIAATAGTLDTQVEPPREHRRPHTGAPLRFSTAPVQQRLTDIAARSGRDGDDALRAFPQPPAVGRRNPGAALGHVAAGQQSAELPEPRVVHRDQCQPTRGNIVRFLLEWHVDTDERLDARRDRGAVEAHHAEQVRTIGDGHGGHAQCLRPFDERADPQDAVDERELGVQVQMDEAGAHDGTPEGRTRRASASFTGAKLRR